MDLGASRLGMSVHRRARRSRAVATPDTRNSFPRHRHQTRAARAQTTRPDRAPCDDVSVRPESNARSPGRLIVVTGLPGSGKTTLATDLAASMPAIRLCPDDWMMASGIDLWDEVVRGEIERFQLTLALGLLRVGKNVIIEWGVWAREERDALNEAARSIGSPVELRYVSATIDELWQRIVWRDLEARWGSRSITRQELEEWSQIYEPPTDEEMATYDPLA